MSVSHGETEGSEAAATTSLGALAERKCTQKSRAALKAAPVVDWDRIVLPLSSRFVFRALIKKNKNRNE